MDPAATLGEGSGRPLTGAGPLMRLGPRATLAILGLAALVMLVSIHYISDRHVVHYAPLGRAAADLRVNLATSHLWLEEYLTGDPRVDLESDVWAMLDQADALTRAMLDGGPLGDDRQAIQPLDEEPLRQRVVTIQGLLVSFRELAHTRVAEPGAAGIGSRLDQHYDAVFRRLLASASKLEREVEVEMAAGRQQSLFLLGLIVAAWLAMLAVGLLSLVRRRRWQEEAEAALQESEKQLLQAQKLEAVGRLASGLAHDVNNYLATINAQCGLAKVLHGETPGVASLMDEVIATVGRTSSLIRRLLAFSRNQPAPRLMVVDLNRLTEELASMMRRLLSDDLELVLHLGDELWQVEVDPSQIEQVLVNLLVNAREAMPEGGRIKVCTANVSLDDVAITGAGEYVLLAVEDEGVGISQEVQDKVFEPFFSTKQDGRQRSGEHSGLGLATVYAIVQQAGGSVRVDSELGHGTRFRIFLPRTHRQPAVVDPEEPRRQAVPAITEAGQGSHLNVLMVEDNAELRRAADAILTVLGHRVTAATDGTAALERLASAEPAFDVVVTDLVIPGPSGREVAKEALRQGCGGVVLVSGYRSRISVQDLLQNPRVRYLDKPYDPRDLMAAIETLAVRETPPGRETLAAQPPSKGARDRRAFPPASAEV